MVQGKLLFVQINTALGDSLTFGLDPQSATYSDLQEAKKTLKT